MASLGHNNLSRYSIILVQISPTSDILSTTLENYAIISIKHSSIDEQSNAILLGFVFYDIHFIQDVIWKAASYPWNPCFGPWIKTTMLPWVKGLPAHIGSAFIKQDQRNPWIKDQLGNALLSTIFYLQLPNFVSCGRDKPSHMTQNLVTVGVKLQAGEWFLFVPWSTDQADLVW